MSPNFKFNPYAVLLQDMNIAIPPDEFSCVNTLAQSVMWLAIDEREELKKCIKYWNLTDSFAIAAADHLLLMDKVRDDLHLLQDPEHRTQLLAAYLYESAWRELQDQFNRQENFLSTEIKTAIGFNPTHITVCLIGDDRPRTFPVSYFGTADVTDFDGERLGEVPVALVVDPYNGYREALVVAHPEYGWVSMGDASCRGFEPEIDSVRLEEAR